MKSQNLFHNLWITEAACLTRDTNEFFANEDGEYKDLDDIANLCNSCPVRVNCIDAAVTSRWIEEGYWGSLKEKRVHIRNHYRRILSEFDVHIDNFAKEFVSV